MEELQVDLNEWLEHYNTERPHRGCRNMGKRPIETFETGPQIRKEAEKKTA